MIIGGQPYQSSINSSNKMILKKYGLTNFGSSSNAFKLMHEIDGELKHYGDDVKNNYKKAIFGN